MNNDTMAHIPVMLQEAIHLLQVKPENWYIDGTFGRGGHTREILKRGGRVFAVDHDAQAIAWGEKSFAHEIADRVLVLIRSNFDKLAELSQLKGVSIAGILFDFGVSSIQLDEADRGFSFQLDAPLDMRMDRTLGVTAKDLVNAFGKKELLRLLQEEAQETHAHVIVDAILLARKKKPIETTGELARLIEKAVGGRGKLHPATKTFLALRMVVNDELGSIERVLPASLDLLSPSGRLVTISFHEGEDRLVKQAMRSWEEQGRGVSIMEKPLTPTISEIQSNPRSRSAKMRVFEKRRVS